MSRPGWTASDRGRARGTRRAATTAVALGALAAGTLVAPPAHASSVVEGRVHTWGATASDEAPPLASEAFIQDLEAGMFGNMALTSDGQVHVWPAVTAEELPGGFTLDQVPDVVRELGATDIAIGVGNAAAITSDGALHLWHDEAFAPQGPITVPDGLRDQRVVDVSLDVMLDFFAGVGEDGNVYDNLGLVLEGDYVAASASLGGGVALGRDGTVAAWGDRYLRDIPDEVRRATVVDVAAGVTHVLALTDRGEVLTWGEDEFLGSGETLVELPAELVGRRVTAIAAGPYNSAVITEDGQYVGWGADDYGQRDLPAELEGGVITATALGFQHSMVAVMREDEPSLLRSTIAADPPVLPADGTSTASLTVAVRNARGDLLPGLGDVVAVATTAGTVGPVTDLGDGTYAAQLTAPEQVGVATVSFTVDGVGSPSTTQVAFTAGAPSVTTSTITADPTSIPADGESRSQVTVRLRDGDGAPVGVGGADVRVVSSAGSLGAVVDNGDGTYSATLTSSTVADDATVFFTIGQAAGTSTARVSFVAGPAAAAESTISADPAVITADGRSTSTIEVALSDAHHNPLGAGGDDVRLATTLGTLGPVEDRGDGTYRAALTAGTEVGRATVTLQVNGEASPRTATVALAAGGASAVASTISASPATIAADGVSTSTVTVTVLDEHGNAVGAGGDEVVLGATDGTLGAVTDHGDGTYSASLTSSTTAGVAEIGLTVDGAPSTATAAVEFVAGAASAETSTIEVEPTVVAADGVSTATASVTLRDEHHNLVTQAGHDVTMTTDAGSLGDVGPAGPGRFAATLTSGTVAGVATVAYEVDGVPGRDTAQVVFAAGPASVETSAITADPERIPADGTSTSTITVTLRDEEGNPHLSGGADVALAATAGTLGEVVDHGDGTYTAALTAGSVAGTATVRFLVDGEVSPHRVDVELVAVDGPTGEDGDGPDAGTGAEVADGDGTEGDDTGGDLAVTGAGVAGLALAAASASAAGGWLAVRGRRGAREELRGIPGV